jgi:hypothetical protein
MAISDRLRHLQLDFRHATGFLSTISSNANGQLAKPLAADFFARDVDDSGLPRGINFNVAFQMMTAARRCRFQPTTFLASHQVAAK